MRAPARLGVGAALALEFALCANCGSDFVPASVIRKTRTLGASVSVEEDGTGRASPRPGERARLQWWVVGPSEPPEISSAFFVCEAAPVRSGLAQCETPPFFLSEPTDVRPQDPIIEFTVPSSFSGEALLIAGVLCEGAAVDLRDRDDLRTAGCAAGARTRIPVVFELPIGTDNRHPRFADDAIALDGTPWAHVPDPSCSNDLVHRMPIGASDPRVQVTFGLDERELFMEERSTGPEEVRERWLVSHFSTAGEFAAQFSVFEEEATARTVSWKLPEPARVPEEGLLVRFFFVVRDGRGGIDRADRALCVVP